MVDINSWVLQNSSVQNSSKRSARLFENRNQETFRATSIILRNGASFQLSVEMDLELPMLFENRNQETFRATSIILRNGASFQLSVEMDLELHWFALLSPVISPQNTCNPLHQCKTKKNPDLIIGVFPRFKKFICFHFKLELGSGYIIFCSDWPL